MKKVYSAKDPLLVGHLKNVLATFGIECVTRKYDLNMGAGELPPIECWPEIWVVDDDKLGRAKKILRKTLAPLDSVKRPWWCTGCGEEVEGQFSECWKCGQSRSDKTARRTFLKIVSHSPRNR